MRILVVEDDAAVAAALVEGIGREGYQVGHEATAAGAVAHVRAQHPHLIVLDVRLPDGSGFDVCRELRRTGARQPILMLTVQADEVDQVLGLEAGADDYVAKPYRLRELLARIRALLRRSYGDLAAGDADLLYAGDLVIDRASARVSRDGTIIDLTPTEYKLLYHLVRNAGYVLPHATLLAKVWGREYVDEVDYLRVYIRRLREKLGDDPEHPIFIRTERGLGYRFIGR